MTTTSYTTGTITLTNGSAEIVGHGTGWATAAIIGGVIYPGAAGNALPFGAEPTDDTHITADVPWMGETGTYAYALVRDTAPGRQAAANAQTLTAYIARLGNPALAALAALGEDMAADRLAYATGDGSMAWTGFSEAARALLEAEDAAAMIAALEAVPAARTVNGEALTADVVLSAADVGLGAVDNTSDADKPVSTAQQAAFDVLDVDLARRIRYDAAQALTAVEQGQAVANIGAGVLGGFRNRLINGDFAVWQRGAGPFAANGYTADRWGVYLASGTFSMQRGSAIGSAWGYAAFVAQINYNGGGSSSPSLYQRIEDARTLAGRRVTVGARVTAAAASLELQVQVVRNFGSGGSPAETIAPWTTIGAIPSGGAVGYLRYAFDMPDVAGKTFGADHYTEVSFRVAQNVAHTIQLSSAFFVEGHALAEADPFAPRHIQQELALCQRYHQRINCGLEGYFPYAGAPLSAGVPFVSMRSIPVPTEVYIAGGGIAACVVAIVGSAVWYKLVSDAAGMAWRQSMVILDNEL